MSTGSTKNKAKGPLSINDFHKIHQKFQQKTQEIAEACNQRHMESHQAYMEKEAMVELADKNAFYKAQMARENYATQIRIGQATLDPPNFERHAQTLMEQLSQSLDEIFGERDEALKNRNDALKTHNDTVKEVSASARESQKKAFDDYLKEKSNACDKVGILQLSSNELIEFGNLLIGMGHELKAQAD
ncbi:MAG: hypothetical protein QNK37_15920 [Acidobacteriota bacterium]|nr:hypothetical protein [Acidobacteriota bacterium]